MFLPLIQFSSNPSTFRIKPPSFNKHRKTGKFNRKVFYDLSEKTTQVKLKEALTNSANEMKHEAHVTQQPRHINKIDEGASTAQRSDSLV